MDFIQFRINTTPMCFFTASKQECIYPCICSARSLYKLSFLWRKDKYLKYWEVFAKDTPGIRRVWYYIICVCLLLVWPIFIFSMIIMSN